MAAPPTADGHLSIPYRETNEVRIPDTSHAKIWGLRGLAMLQMGGRREMRGRRGGDNSCATANDGAHVRARQRQRTTRAMVRVFVESRGG